MTAPADPDIIEEIREHFATDLSWVTFAEKDPTEPCYFVECDKDADWSLNCLPCGHEYFFCTVHTQYTRSNMAMYEALTCTQCHTVITDIKYEPLKEADMPNAIVNDMLEEMKFVSHNAEEVFKFHATALIEDFNIPAAFVVDMMHSLKAAILIEDLAPNGYATS